MADIEEEKVNRFLDRLEEINILSYIEVIKLLDEVDIQLEPRAVGELLHCLKEGRQIKRFIPLILNEGIYMEDLWALDISNSEWLVPRLKIFKETLISMPPGMKMEKWQEIIDKIIFAHEINSKDDRTLKVDNWDRVDEGIKLYGEYYHHLWD